MTSDAKKAEGFDAALTRVSAWIENYERAPEMWGPPFAQELAMYNLVETRQLLLRPAAHRANPFETRDAMIRWVASINGGPSSWFLTTILREEGRLSELPKLLGDFARWVARELPPEEP